MSDLFQFIDQPVAVRPHEALDAARLEAHLKAHLNGAAGTLSIQQFPGGYSNLTYFLRLGDQEMVLRRPPFGAAIKSAHDMAREYKILSALHPTYGRVPRPLLYCEDSEVIGAPFYVMDRVRGVILRNRPPKGLMLGPDKMRAICQSLVKTLVDLHQVDYQAVGLGDLGKPDGYVERQVMGWIKRYQDAQTDHIAEMEQVAAWLSANRPTDSASALIHNDFRCDNMVLNPADLTQPLAILDWEMATIGDPLMDLGTTLGYWAEAEDNPMLKQFGCTHLPGSLNRREVVERYAALSGRPITSASMVFYFACGLYKLAVIGQQIYARYKKGLTQDERFGGLIFAVHACAQLATRAIDAGRIEDL